MTSQGLMWTDGSGVVLAVRVIPRASATRIAGQRAGRLLIQTTAPPLEGRANEAVRRLLARALRVPNRQVTVVAGASARDKQVRIEGLTSEQVAQRLDISG